MNTSKVTLAKATLRQALDLLRKPPKLSVCQWAELHRTLSREVTARPGRYRTTETPYQVAPQESFTDPVDQMTVLDFASRLGKTEMLNNLEGYHIDHDPAPMLIVYPTLDSAQKWSKKFFMPMVRATVRLWRKLRDKSRDATNTILSKRFPGGSIDAIGANSPSGFRQIQARIVICDEIDAMESSSEGDPIILAFKRADNYRNSVQVLASTPTIKGSSRIEHWLEKSDRNVWMVPCPRCAGAQLLKWSQVRWPKGEPQKAVYVCELCHVELSDLERVAMIKRGTWTPTQPFTGIRGYWLNGLNTTFPPKKGYVTKLHQMAAEFLDAEKQGSAGIRTWTNTFLAESYEEKTQKPPEAETLLLRAEPYGPEFLPAGIIVLTGAVDCQHDRLELEVRGWGKDEETWGVEVMQFFGNPEQLQVWKDLDDALSKTYLHATGIRLRIACVCIDSGDGKTTKTVYSFVRGKLHRRIHAIKGSSIPGAPLVSRPRLNKINKVQLFSIGTDVGKSTIYSRLEILSPGPRFMHFPQGNGYDAEYFRQVTAEEVKTTFHYGFAKRIWIKVRPRNEGLDLLVYGFAAFEILNPHLARIAATFPPLPEPGKATTDPVIVPAVEPKKDLTPEPPRRTFQRMPRRPGGFVNGWRR